MNCIYCDQPLKTWNNELYDCLTCSTYTLALPNGEVLDYYIRGRKFSNYRIMLSLDSNETFLMGRCTSIFSIPGLTWVFPDNVDDIIAKLLNLKAFL